MTDESNRDTELLQKYLKTNSLDILGELYANYIHLVYGVCLKYLKNRDDSKDAVNKIFELLISEIPKFDIKNFRSWLFVVTKNYCLMEIRKKKTEDKRIEKYSEHVFMESDQFLHPIDRDNNEEMEEGLKECIDKLKKEQQSSIQLFYYENKCYEEIAEALNVPEKKVKSYIQNARRNLKICLENYKIKDEV
jgi:RNA polymerase sigma-70 factor, ECF subfamily